MAGSDGTGYSERTQRLLLSPTKIFSLICEKGLDSLRYIISFCVTMLTENIKELEAAQAKVEELRKKIDSERFAELAALPAKYGYTSLSAFVKALKEAAGPSISKGKGRRKAAKVVKDGPRRRAKITDEIRAQVKQLVEAGKTGSEIASSLGISLPSVQNIKKAMGLVKAREA